MDSLKVFVLILLVVSASAGPRPRARPSSSSTSSSASSSSSESGSSASASSMEVNPKKILAVVPEGRTVPVGAQLAAIKKSAAEIAHAQRAAIQNAIAQAEAAHSVGSQAQAAAVRDAIAQTHNERIQEANNQGQIQRNSIAQAQAVQIQIELARKLAARNAAIQALQGDHAGYAQAVSNANSEAHVGTVLPPTVPASRTKSRLRARPVIAQEAQPEIEVVTVAPQVQISVPQTPPQPPTRLEQVSYSQVSQPTPQIQSHITPISYSSVPQSQLLQSPVVPISYSSVPLSPPQPQTQLSPIRYSQVPLSFGSPNALHEIAAPQLGPSSGTINNLGAQLAYARAPTAVTIARPPPSFQLQQVRAPQSVIVRPRQPLLVRPPPKYEPISRPVYAIARPSPPPQQSQHFPNPWNVPFGGGGYSDFGFGSFPDLAFGASSFLPWG